MDQAFEYYWSGTVITSAIVKSKAHELGFDLVGIADVQDAPHFEAFSDWIAQGSHATMSYLARHRELRRNPGLLLEGACSVIVVGLNYYQPFESENGEPRIAKYALGRDYHKVLRAKLKSLARALDFDGDTFRICVDSAPILERDFAQLAGLGWFGKNTMIINSVRGSFFFLACLVTTLPLQPDKPAIGGCGKCTKCIEACPTGALIYADGRWQLDARRCISYLTIEHRGPINAELARKMGDHTFGCDICQDVCPFNQVRESQPERSAMTGESEFVQRRQFPSLIELSEVGDADWNRLTAGSAVRRAGLNGLRRNARINLSNLPQARETVDEPAPSRTSPNIS